MKKILFPSMLVISLVAFAQYTQKDQHNMDAAFLLQTEDQMFIEDFQFELNMEEQDEAFEFDSRNYLPFDFNPYNGLFTLEYEITSVEEDALFEFDTKKYLPFRFDPNLQPELSEVFEMETEDKDAAFDFDTKMYLPENFNPYFNCSDLKGIANL